MKRNKISLIALVVTIGLVASFAFTSKPVTMRAFVYDPLSGQQTTETGLGMSIIPAELIEDNNLSVDAMDYWDEASVASHQPGSDLLGIEFDDDDFTLEQATAMLHTFYVNYDEEDNEPLPTDGGEIGTGDVVKYYKF